MKKYYFKEDGVQYGPLELNDLKTQNLTAETPVWYHPLPHWTTAGKVEELKDVIKKVSPVVETKEEIKLPVVETPVVTAGTEPLAAANPEPIVTVKQEPVGAAPEPQISPVVKPVTLAPTTIASPVAAVVVAPVTPAASFVKPGKRNTAWISWVLSLLVLGATGYFIYKDMQKNDGLTSDRKDTGITDSTGNTTFQQTVTETPATLLPEADTTTELTLGPESTTIVIPKTEPPTTGKPATVKVQPSTTRVVTIQPATSKMTSAQIQQLLEQKIADDKKKEQQATGKEAEIRNHWSKYISLGKLDYKSHSLSGIKAFDVPLFNSTDAVLDRVTVRLDYIKSGGGVYKSETITLNDIQPRSGVNGKAPASSRGTSVNVYITSVTSKKLHFCYPQNNGNAADPYFCN